MGWCQGRDDVSFGFLEGFFCVFLVFFKCFFLIPECQCWDRGCIVHPLSHLSPGQVESLGFFYAKGIILVISCEFEVCLPPHPKCIPCFPSALLLLMAV